MGRYLPYKVFRKDIILIEIQGTVKYEHSLTATFKIGLDVVELSMSFWKGTVYVLLPEDIDTLWRIVGIELQLFEFLKRLKDDTYQLQFVINCKGNIKPPAKTPCPISAS